MNKNLKRPGRNAVLSQETIEICKEKLKMKGITINSLAKEYHVHPTTMRIACKSPLKIVNDDHLYEIPEGMLEIPGYSKYFIDGNGYIFSIRQSNELRQLSTGPSGYGLKVFLVPDHSSKGHTVQVHDLVCLTYHGPRPTLEHKVFHLDRNRMNNRPENLKWSEPGELIRPRGGAIGEQHGRAKLTNDDILEIFAYHQNNESIINIAREKNIHPTTISGILKRRLWKHVEIREDCLPNVEPLQISTTTVLNGEQHGRAKLTKEKVDEIRSKLHRKTNSAIALEYHVHPTTIARIRSGIGWIR
jgi:hypothetical protein